MGIKKGYSVISALIGDKFAFVTPNQVDVLAIDANFLIYYAYNEFLEKECTQNDQKYITEHTPESLIGCIISTFMKYIEMSIKKLMPEVLVLCFDGVAPFPKLIDQHVRRMEQSTNDVYTRNQKLLFSTQFIYPNSPILNKLDVAVRSRDWSSFSMSGFVYSGPFTPGEGEHKIMPILASLFRYGGDAIEGFHNSSWVPKNAYILGNDNDLHVLSCLLMATFETNRPQLYMFNDFQSRDAGEPNIGLPNTLKFIDESLVLNGIISGKYEFPGSTDLEKTLVFTYLLSILGNDFLPRVNLGNEPKNATKILFEGIVHAAQTVGKSPIPANLSHNFKIGSLPLLMEEDAEEVPRFEGLVCIKKVVMQIFVALENYVFANFQKLSIGTTENVVVEENLHKLGSMNSVANIDLNGIAITASTEYIRMMDNVLCYYMNSTCIVPNSVAQFSLETMPEEFYGYGFCPPSYSYLAAGAQLLTMLAAGEASSVPKALQALSAWSICEIDHFERPKNARFLSRRLQAFFVLTRKAQNLPPEIINSEDAEVYSIDTQCIHLQYFMMQTDPTITNTAMFPVALKEQLYAIISDSANPNPEQIDPVDVKVFKTGKTFQSNYAGAISLN